MSSRISRSEAVFSPFICERSNGGVRMGRVEGEPCGLLLERIILSENEY